MERERETSLADFQARIAFAFQNPALLREALTHSSLMNECPDLGILDNQRLEFLGAALLDVLVGEWLFDRYPDAREGELTMLRAQLVRNESLSAWAAQLDLGSYLLLGKGEAASGGRARAANLCAGLEALVGAIYLDQGLEATRAWIWRFLEQRAQEIDQMRSAKDAKSQLQEFTQGALKLTPSYRTIRQAGPDHARVFTAQALVGEEVWGEGSGPSKQIAEQAAAEAALRAHGR